jgi:hypothetical protein
MQSLDSLDGLSLIQIEATAAAAATLYHQGGRKNYAEIE